jgi:hypothetical protein
VHVRHAARRNHGATAIRSRRLQMLGALSLVLASCAFATSGAAASGLSIRVLANHLVNQNGAVVRLLGVDRSGTEYACVQTNQVFSGPSDAASVRAMVAWHINAVRVPLNEDCWLGINGVTTTSAQYQKAITSYVATLQSFGLYVILDLHWAAPGTYQAVGQWPMADADHAPAFWKSVATTFKHDHGVIFDLFNEPYIHSWSCWLHGCQVSYDFNGTSVTYHSAGMQQLVDAVRSTGATTPLLLGGLAYANNVRHWYRYEPKDPDHQLVVSFHTYTWNPCSNVGCWNKFVAPLAAKVPVVTDEFGENAYSDRFASTFMSWADRHGVSYLGWSWNVVAHATTCNIGPSLINK